MEIIRNSLNSVGPGTAGIAQRIESRYGLDAPGMETTLSSTFVLSRNYVMSCGHNQY